MVTALDVFPELSVRAEGVELRTMRWTDFPAYADIVVGGLFTAEQHDSLGPWYSPRDPAGSARRAIAGQLVSWSDLRPEEWSLDFGIFVNGALVGAQTIRAAGFRESRAATTESLLGPRFRGRGTGTLSRVAVLHLAFEVLGAETVTAAALADNAASHAISRSVGYRDEGTVDRKYGGRQFVLQQWVMDRELWEIERKRWTTSAVGTSGLVAALGLGN